MRTIISALDSVANSLESRGLTNLASAVDTVANTVVAGSPASGLEAPPPNVVQELTADRSALSIAAANARAALAADPELRKSCEHIATLMKMHPGGPWTTDVKNLVEALSYITTEVRTASVEDDQRLLAIAIMLEAMK